jgi:hypothetical protein
MKMHQPRDSDSRRVTLDRWELRRAGESLEGFDADHRGDVRGLKSHSTRWLSLVSQRPHSAALGGRLQNSHAITRINPKTSPEGQARHTIKKAAPDRNRGRAPATRELGELLARRSYHPRTDE